MTERMGGYGGRITGITEKIKKAANVPLEKVGLSGFSTTESKAAKAKEEANKKKLEEITTWVHLKSNQGRGEPFNHGLPEGQRDRKGYAKGISPDDLQEALRGLEDFGRTEELSKIVETMLQNALSVDMANPDSEQVMYDKTEIDELKKIRDYIRDLAKKE